MFYTLAIDTLGVNRISMDETATGAAVRTGASREGGQVKFYIASRLEAAPRVRELKTILESYGHEHTYDWTVHGSVQNDGADVIREVSEREVLGVVNADANIVLLPGGRGTHTELGIAIACK